MDILSSYTIGNAASSLWDKCWLSIQWWPGWPRFPHQPQSERLYIKSNPAGPSSLCVAYHIQLESGLHCILYFVQDGVLANTLKICAKNSLHHHPAVTAHVWTGTHKKFHCKCHKQLSFRSNKQQLLIINVYCVVYVASNWKVPSPPPKHYIDPIPNLLPSFTYWLRSGVLYIRVASRV